MPLAPVTAVVPYRLGDSTHRLLRGYKDSPVRDVRRRYTRRLACILDSWLDERHHRLEARVGGSWDLVVTVPSSNRPTGTPVNALVDLVPSLAELHRSLLLRGPDRTDHLVPARRGFVIDSEAPFARDSRVLVVDDTFITGARAQSAVAALRIAGLRVAGVLVVGRVVAPEIGPSQAGYWTASEAERSRIVSGPGPGQRSKVTR
jgi:hypothetical protein